MTSGRAAARRRLTRSRRPRTSSMPMYMRKRPSARQRRCDAIPDRKAADSGASQIAAGDGPEVVSKTLPPGSFRSSLSRICSMASGVGKAPAVVAGGSRGSSSTRRNATRTMPIRIGLGVGAPPAVARCRQRAVPQPRRSVPDQPTVPAAAAIRGMPGGVTERWMSDGSFDLTTRPSGH